MKYTEVDIVLSECGIYRDMLIYSLGDEGPYDSFEETAKGLKAYVPSEQYDERFLEQCLDEVKKCAPALEYKYTVTEPEDKDYNEAWERSHQAVLVENFCWVRAPFHPHPAGGPGH